MWACCRTNVQVESSGIATFTFFMPLGCGANMTAFHYETKRLRSLNCGSGDLILQPLATEENLKKFERVHAAIFGEFRRSNQVTSSILISALRLLCSLRSL